MTNSQIQSENKGAAVDRRHHERYPAYFNITVAGAADGERPLTAFIANVSQRGVCVITPRALDPGAVVKLQVAHVLLVGEVVHSTAEGDHFRTGIRVPTPADGAADASELLGAMLVAPRVLGATSRTPSRRRLRHPTNGTLRVLLPDDDLGERVIDAKIENASEDGARLRTDERIPVQSSVSFSCEALGVTGTALVRYCRLVRGKYNIGLEFSGSHGTWAP
jgi:PilZ domain